jgi:hypothetical protein
MNDIFLEQLKPSYSLIEGENKESENKLKVIDMFVV